MDKKKLEQIEEVAKEAKKEAARVDILDVLLDEENTDPIVLTDEAGKDLHLNKLQSSHTMKKFIAF